MKQFMQLILVLIFLFPTIIKAQDIGETSAAKVLDELSKLRQQLEQTLTQYNDATKQLNVQIERKDEEIRRKDNELNLKNQLITSKDFLISEKDERIKELKELKDNTVLATTEKVNQIKLKEEEIRRKEENINSLVEQIKIKDQIINAKDRTIESKEQNITTAKQSIEVLQDSIKGKEQAIILEQGKVKGLQFELDISVDKRKWVRMVQGVGMYKFRTPQYELAPQSATNPNTMVISNKNSGNWEGDFMTGFAVMVIDIKKKNDGNKKLDPEQTLSFGPFIGFGGKDLFKNFYIGADFKLYMIHINAGFNFHEFEVLKNGFNAGDILQPGQTIPTTNEWKIGLPYFGVSIDTEFLANKIGGTKSKDR